MKKLGVLLLCAGLLLSGCSSAVKEPIAATAETMKMYQCGRDHLDKKIQPSYDAVLQGYKNLDKEIILKNVTISDVNDIHAAIKMDHPELYYLEDSFDYVTDKNEYESKATYLFLKPSYSMIKSEIESRDKEIKQVTEKIINTAKKKKSDYEKVKYVYDYLIDHTSYDEKAKENQNILSTFLEHKTVCAGYAKGMQYLLNQIGVPCTYITGFTRPDKRDVSHAWNMVKMDGNYYYMDVTNGDMLNNTKESRYMYFAMTKKQILAENRPFTDDYMEDTPSRKDSYFMKEGAYFTSCDKQQMTKLIQKSANKGYRLVFQCSSKALGEQLDQMLTANNFIFNMTGYDYYAYYRYEDTNTYIYVPDHQKL